ncbi:uncharacterized protein LOC111712733, partial [Eurytemora carolleeae]|uniref:uncharacterized protein LOC111712733 n=1 Tax=Eurytemora carolleeae TaxID=1294199 RepID=UPI000C78A5CE
MSLYNPAWSDVVVGKGTGIVDQSKERRTRNQLDVLSEEQSGMFLCHPIHREKWKVEESERVSYEIIPAGFVSFMSNEMYIDDPDTVKKDIMNANYANKPLQWPITAKSNIPKELQYDILEIIIIALEKFPWKNLEICHYIK